MKFLTHTIQLAVKKILLDQNISSVIAEIVELINLFISNKVQRLLLQNAQPAKTAFKLIRPCDTRWSYTLFAIKRLLKLRNYIDQALQEGNQSAKSNEFWGKCSDLVTILTPFHIATDVIQQDSATLFDVGVQFKELQIHASSIKTKHPSLSLHISDCITNEWKNHIHEEATIAAAILSAYPNLAKLYSPQAIIRAQDWIISWGATFLEFYNYSSAANIKQELTRQLVEFTGRIERFQGFESRIESTKTKVIKAETSYEYSKPINVWASFQSGALEISTVAIAILSVCASEAAVERSFSIQDRIHSKSRNRSKDDLVEAQVFVKFNTEALEGKQDQCSNFEEIEINQNFDANDVVELAFLGEEIENKDSNLDCEMEEVNAEVPEPNNAAEAEEEIVIEEERVNNLRAIASPDEIKAFALRYIEANKLTKSSRLFGDKENALANEAAVNNPPVIANIVDLKRLIKSLAPNSY